MNIKSIINETIEKEMPFLRKIILDSLSDCNSDFISDRLLPYLFYTNTIDQNRRIIPVFLRKNEDIIYLPLFFSMALFKIYADNFLSTIKYKNLHFTNKVIEVQDFNSAICKLTSINFTSRDITISNGRGSVSNIDFSELEHLKYINSRSNYIKQLQKYFEQIEDFKELVRIGDNPLELIQRMNTEEFKNSNTYHGAVFFTHDPRFLKSKEYRDITINDGSFLNTIPTSKLSYCRGEISFTPLGDKRCQAGKRVNEINEFLLFSELENFDDFHSIKEKKPWIDTLIFDFTKNVKGLNDVLKTVANNYYTSLKGGLVKDIYMIFNEKDLGVFPILQKANLNYTPFLLTADQKQGFLEDGNVSAIDILFSEYVEFNIEFKDALASIKKLCSETHVVNLIEPLLKPLFEIKKRYHSFYDANTLGNDIDYLSKSIEEVRHNWFFSSNYNQLFSNLNSLLESLRQNLNNPKLSVVKNLSIEQESSVCVISYNCNEDDQLYIKSILKLGDVTFLNPQKIRNPLSELERFNCVLILNLNRELSFICNLNIFHNNIYCILNDSERNLYNRTGDKIIPHFSDKEKLAEVLNIKIPEVFNLDIVDALDDQTEVEVEFNLDAFVANVLKENKHNSKYSTNDKNIRSVGLFFKDGTSRIVNENKYFFIHKDNISTLSDCHVKAKDLTVDSIVFILNHDSEAFEKLIWNVSECYPDVKKILELDLLWRKAIEVYIGRSNKSIDLVREMLNKEGYIIQSNQAVQNWINSEVYEPRNVNHLISVLCDLEIIQNHNSEEITKAIKTTKKLKTSLPNELRKHHVADLNDLDYKSNFIFPELIEEMYQFMDIKTISLIV